jgi:hypothetical protein
VTDCPAYIPSVVTGGSVGPTYELGSLHTIDAYSCDPGVMEVEARAATAGFRIAQRYLNGRVVWWWQRLDDPDDTRQRCWLERRQAISYMQGVLQREPPCGASVR